MKKILLNEKLKKQYKGSLVLNFVEGVIEDYGEDLIYENIELELAVQYALESYFMYDEDKWELLKEYCNPDNASLSLAFEHFMEDVYNLILEVEDEVNE